jgi:RNA polymerase sigma factor (sigma-70 family)
VTEIEIIEGCKKGDDRCQKAFYDTFAPKMYAICLKYLNQKEDAEDILVEGLYKAMSNLDKYDALGSLEGWVRRIIINESLMLLRKRNKIHFETNDSILNIADSDFVSIETNMAANDILKLIEKLPLGYKTIFNLYVIEGYKHREIAELLNISIHTSKSQLIQAKEKLQILMQKNN